MRLARQIVFVVSAALFVAAFVALLINGWQYIAADLAWRAAIDNAGDAVNGSVSEWNAARSLMHSSGAIAISEAVDALKCVVACQITSTTAIMSRLS